MQDSHHLERAALNYAPQAQGLLAASATAPIAIALSLSVDLYSPYAAAAASSSFLLISSALLLPERPRPARRCAFAALVFCAVAALPTLVGSPQAALLAWVSLVSVAFAVSRPAETIRREPEPLSYYDRGRLCTRWAAGAALLFLVLLLALDPPRRLLSLLPLYASTGAAAIIAIGWAGHAWTSGVRRRPMAATLLLALLLIPALAAAADSDWLFPAGILLLGLLFLSTAFRESERSAAAWWEPLLENPARLLLTTFLSLCALGTAALLLPGTTTADSISFSDALFTSVSAVCVTGLIVLDTAKDFSFFGQACILALIQLGGLGIMSISTVALYYLGRRLSLRHEQIVASIHGEEDSSLVESLRRVLRMTFLTELVGAMVLFPLFYRAGDQLGEALWRAVFTAISAFCNAGFALQSASLIPYAQRPLILHTVAALIVLGGIAPAVSLSIFRRLRGRRLDAAPRIVIWTTALLLSSGAAAILALEWSNTLGAMAFIDRIHNAWFQSVTLRTAGFNSIDIAKVSRPTAVIMILFMFIGGSPGGTAGGIKTTTLAILALAMWASIIGRREVVAGGRWLPSTVIYRAIAVVGAGAAVWFFTVLALLITQDIPAADLLFEATSALGTVGLSAGATTALDDVGRVIIIGAMFLGRIGPLTLFLLLGSEPEYTSIKYPEGRIPIT